jgi:hypothetical protein
VHDERIDIEPHRATGSANQAAAPDSPRGAVAATEHRSPHLARGPACESRGGQDRAHGAVGHGEVLRCERIDGRGNDGYPTRAQPWRDAGAAREDDRVRVQGVWPQERPRRPNERVGMVGPDMRSVDDRSPACSECGSQARGLRVVKDDDIPHSNPALQRCRVRRQSGLVYAALRLPQLHAVAGMPVEHVVNPFRQPEELRMGPDHGPPDVQVGSEPVRDEGAQELSNPASSRCRVDHPHGSARETHASRL